MGAYQPSNSTEGDIFMLAFCDKCQRDRRHNCSILARTFAYSVDEAGYPKEWVSDDGWKDGDSGGPAGLIGAPRCTAFEPRRPNVRGRTTRKPTGDDLFQTPTDTTGREGG